jgi:hypothetical protein
MRQRCMRKRKQDEESTGQHSRSSTSHSDPGFDNRAGVDEMWKGTLGGDSANEASHTSTALRDVTADRDRVAA